MNVAIIPARGGSKRIPRKNIRLFNDRPLIAYSIAAALESGCFGRVVVTTEDAEVAEIARREGAEVPFVRPAELCDDYVGTIPILQHALRWLLTEAFLKGLPIFSHHAIPIILPRHRVKDMVSVNRSHLFQSAAVG